MVKSVFQKGLKWAQGRCEFLISVVILALAVSSPALRAQTATIGWSASTSAGVVGYLVCYGNDGVTFKNQIDAGTNTYLTVNNLPLGATTYFEIMAYDANLNLSPASGVVQYTAPNPPVVTNGGGTNNNQFGSSGGGSSNVTGVFGAGENGASNIVGRTVVTNAGNGFTILVGGHGTIAPTRIASAYMPGKKYVLAAIPARGSVFDGWLSNGVAVSSALRYSFVVQSNLAVQANFITNPFVPVVGVYHGLFYVPTNAVEESSGSIVVTVTSAGTYNARLYIGARAYAASGAFSVSGAAVKVILRPGLSPITLQLLLGATNSPITGTVSNVNWTADLVADPAIYSRTNPAPQAGKYTMVIPGSTNAGQPAGNGFGTVTVTGTGNVTFIGNLGDGTPVTSTSTVSSQGQWPFYIPLCGGGGSILGWLAFTNGQIAGQLGWFKQPQATARLYAAGFTNNADVIGSSYQYTNGVPVLGFTDGQLVLTNGDLTSSLTNQIVFGQNNQATNLTFNPSSGQFRARVVDPATSKPILVSGVVLQDQGFGAGFFPGTTGTGNALLLPAQ